MSYRSVSPGKLVIPVGRIAKLVIVVGFVILVGESL